ncbi:lysM domain receptor-like kinase 3 isoform X2 [Ananas comosus]|uniref:non-specific serine/threonine protein kinase n=1 Tax=Ananas comosus TaxID=4615 RepID=A0A6P5GGI9_ANACO|nr:lysM domain receptor-like kinase 3 isoform X2 [Ananas comosus]
MELGLGLGFLLVVVLLGSLPLRSESSCRKGCDLAIGSYYLTPGLHLNLTYVGSLFSQTYQEVYLYNRNLSSPDSVPAGSRVNVSFPCDCLGGGAFLGHVFTYQVGKGDTYSSIAATVYANLTTATALAAANSYPVNNVPLGAEINVTVNCSCGDADVSSNYGLFVTYPLRPGDSLASVAAEYGLSSQQDLLERYNPGVNFSAGTGIVFVPTEDLNGSYLPLPPRSGLRGGAIAGISGAVIVVLLLSAICIYFGVYRRKKGGKVSLLSSAYGNNLVVHGHDTVPPNGSVEITPHVGSTSQLAAFTADKSVEFSYEELARATDDFNLTNKIGQGGFGAVYYAELRGEKAAIKKMDMKASREFFAEVKVLTHVHHLNLVRLLGYCVKDSLFLVYEYIDNGNLSQHLRGSGRNPLQWSARVQIALDAARGLEYIHEHTVPAYIHRDIKSANILIDSNFRGKVADFGLTKLTEVGNMPVQTRLVGTFGYMPPEYAQMGDVSPKVDVYAFGVVLYELISAKEAILRTGPVTDSKGLVGLFEDALGQPDPMEHVRKLVDPRLGDNFPLDSVHKMALLAKACTQENPQLRPSMQAVAVALMILSSNTEELVFDGLYAKHPLINLMSGR